MRGDDFIEKPFDLNVLTAKVQALLRRTYSFQGQLNVLEYKGVILNLNGATVTWQDEKLDLTKNDFRILKLLMQNAGRIMSREQIMDNMLVNGSQRQTGCWHCLAQQLLVEAIL